MIRTQPCAMSSSQEPKPSTKRNFFQKPAWATQRQPAETERSQLFERASDCHAEIVAEKDRRKKEKEERIEKARRADEEKKKRDEDHKRSKAKELMSRSLSEAYLDVESSPESIRPPKRKATVIELDDSDNEPPTPSGNKILQAEIKRTSFGLVDDHDNSLNDTHSQADCQKVETDSKSDGPNPPLHILIDTKIPATKPLVVKRYYRDNMRIVRKTWCERQGFSAEQTKSVILTWRGKRVYDVANCKSLGIELNHRGEPLIKAGADGYDGEGDKIVFVATTFEIVEQEQKEAARRKDDSDGEIQPAQEQLVRIVLRAKNRDDLKISVKPVSSNWAIFVCNFI